MPKKEKVMMGISYPDGSPVISGDLLKVEGISSPVAARAYDKPRGGMIRIYTYWDNGPKSMSARRLKAVGFDRWEAAKAKPAPVAPKVATPARRKTTKGLCIISQLDYDHVEVVNL